MNDPLAADLAVTEHLGTGVDLAETNSPATQPIDISALIAQQAQE